MNRPRRVFVQAATAIVSLVPLKVTACAQSFNTVLPLEGHMATVGDKSLRNYLDRELGTNQWEKDNGEKIHVNARNLERQIIPFTIQVAGGNWIEMSIFLERYVPYRGKKWHSFLENRDINTLFFGRTNAKLLPLRYRVMTLRCTNAEVGEVSSRIRSFRTDGRLIVAVTVEEVNGRRTYVRALPMMEEPQWHCGGTYFVDSYQDALNEISLGVDVYPIDF